MLIELRMKRTFESFGEMKLMMKFCLCFNKILKFEIYFPSFPWEIVFGVISSNYLCI